MDPCARKISHAVGHLSLGTTTPEPSFLEHMLRDSRSHRNEKPKHRKAEAPLLPTLQKACDSHKDPARPQRKKLGFTEENKKLGSVTSHGPRK